MKSRNDEIRKLTTKIAQLKVTISLREERDEANADTWQESIERVSFEKYKENTESYRTELNKNQITLAKLEKSLEP